MFYISKKNIKYDSFIEYADSKVTVQCILELPLSDRQIFSDTGGPRLEKHPWDDVVWVGQTKPYLDRDWYQDFT